MKTVPFLPFAAGLVLLLGAGSGCASSPGAAAGPRPAVRYGEFEYAWRDPAFYEPWYDPAAFVLPPPPPGAPVSGVRARPAAAESARLKELDYH